MRWRHSSPVPPRKMAPSTMVTAHKTAKRRTFPLSRDATAEWMVTLLESRQMGRNTGGGRLAGGGGSADALAQVEEVRNDEDGEDRRFRGDQRVHPHLPAGREPPVD